MDKVGRRLRRGIDRGVHGTGELGSRTENALDRYLFRRMDRLAPVRRFVISWLLLMVLLIGGLVGQNILLSGYYQTVRAVPGGIYKEGVLGNFTNANPIYATSEADTTVSRLLFAGLFKYDEKGRLINDLASGYSIDSRGTTYTVKLKPHLYWQDGKPLTSADVLYTYQLIQNPDVQSPLRSGWEGVTVSAPDSQTVVFKLPSTLASFIYSLTTGIVPQHALANTPAADMRSADFNTVHPVGAGPFMWREIQVVSSDPATAEQQIALVPFPQYVGGTPKLEEFIVHTFASQQQLLSAFRSKQLTAAEGLTELPADLKKQGDVIQHNFLLRAETMTFFKTTSGVLADQKVRAALIQASNMPDIISNLGYPTRAVKEPILPDQPGYDPALAESGFNLKAAQAALDADGWVIGKGGLRTKSGTALRFSLTAADTAENRSVAGELAHQWQAAGASVDVELLNPVEFQTALTSHSYEALLYGITIGADPDVFVYWDSSQADIRSAQRLNFSEYKNSKADLALEAGRTRLDPALRAVKYKPFLEAWQQDSPALAMYQPRVLYVTNGMVDGLHDMPLNSPAGRLSNVQNWQIREAKVTD